MLELIRQWLVGITCAAMVVALAEGLTPPGTIRKIGKLTGGLVLLVSILQPVVELDPAALTRSLTEYKLELGAYSAQLEEENGELMKSIIEEQSAAYILDKAAPTGHRLPGDGAGPPGKASGRSGDGDRPGNAHRRAAGGAGAANRGGLRHPGPAAVLRKRGRGMKTEALGAWSKRLRGVFGRYKFVLLVILAGAALLLLPSVGEKETAAEQTAEQTSLLQSVDALERRLEAALSRMDGAGEVTVVLTVKSSGRQILAQDGKTTERGETTDTQLTTVVVSRGSGSEEPVALQQLSPQYQGALVVCSGGDADAVRLKIVEAVSALTGLGADKISVCKGK